MNAQLLARGNVPLAQRIEQQDAATSQKPPSDYQTSCGSFTYASLCRHAIDCEACAEFVHSIPSIPRTT